MSKCPLQLYLNDKYLDSCPSVQVSNDKLKRTLKECYRPELKYQKQFNKPVLEDDKSKFTKKHCRNKSTSVLNVYLQQHSKSIEAYHALQKQQEEVLNLCKQKIAQRFPSCVKAVVNDEDIIKALRIAANSKSELDGKNGDRITQAVLNVILSNDKQNIDANARRGSDDEKNQTKNKFRPDVSISEYFNSKRKTMLNKFTNMFSKNNGQQRTYFTASDNYFNNSEYVMNTSTMGIVRYPAITEDTNYSSGDDKKGKFKQFLHKFGDITNLTKNPEGGSSNSSAAILDPQKQKKRKQLFAYYCAYQRDVDLLKSEIQKQKNEIRSIQKNLNQCLTILKTFGEKKDHRKSFRGDAAAYHVFTPNEFKGYNNPAEPYSRYYQNYKAETMAKGSINSSSGDKASTNSSTNAGRCPQCCCFKKKSKKKKKPQTRQIQPDFDCQCPKLCDCPKPSILKVPSHVSEPHFEPTIPPSPQPASERPSFDCRCRKSRMVQPDHIELPEEVVKVDTAQDTNEGFVTVSQEGEGDQTTESGVEADTLPSEDTDASSKGNKKKKRKKKEKKRKGKKPKEPKPKRKKKGKGKDKEADKVAPAPDGKPRKRSCCIRCLKFLCCGSACI